MITSILYETKIETSCRARGEATGMRKEYRDAIIRGIVSGISVGVLFTIFLYLTQGEVPWASLFLYPIFFAFAHLISAYLRKRREAKKEEKVQRRE